MAATWPRLVNLDRSILHGASGYVNRCVSDSDSVLPQSICQIRLGSYRLIDRLLMRRAERRGTLDLLRGQVH